MGILARLAGSGFGSKWGVSWAPEALFTLPFGVALGWALQALGLEYWICIISALLGWLVSYGGMQAATWSFLKWETADNRYPGRSFTLKPVVDFIAARFGFSLGNEGYSWIAAGLKGFIIGLPVGGIFTAILWPLGYELGSHAKGRVEKYGLDPHIFSEFFSGALGGVSIFIFIFLAGLL